MVGDAYPAKAPISSITFDERDEADIEWQETLRLNACFEPVWSVWRQDENGNYCLVKGGLTKADALSLVREYEQKGHKLIGSLGGSQVW